MEGDEYQYQTEHVAEVVAGIRQQRQRVLRPAYEGFDTHKQQVQDNAEDKDAVHGGGHDVMMMVTVMVMLVVVMVMMFV
jgi:hypothetical protein